jgi:hypothetical protein
VRRRRRVAHQAGRGARFVPYSGQPGFLLLYRIPCKSS